MTPTPQARIRADFPDANRIAANAESSERPSRPQPIHLSAAINETIGFQFSVAAENAVILKPKLSITSLKSTEGQVDSSAMQLFRLVSVHAPRLSGWHIRQIAPANRVTEPLDVLVPISAPRGGLGDRIEPKQTLFFWADIFVPKGTSAGIYSGELQFFSDKQSVSSIPLELTVWPFVLPDETRASMIAEVDHTVLSAVPGNDAVVQATMRMLHDHRLTPVLPKLHPEVELEASGGIKIDWSDFDARVRPFLNGSAFVDRRGLSYWPVPVEGLFDSTISSAPLSASAKFVEGYLRQCGDHFASEGWSPRAYLMLPKDACSKSSDSPAVAAAEHLHTQLAPIRVASSCFPQDMRPFGWLNYTPNRASLQPDIWIPPAQFYDPRAMAEERGRGHGTWVRVDRPPFSGSVSILAPATYTQVLAWQIEKLGADNGLLGVVNRWPRFDAAAQDCVTRDANVLIYPGTPYGLIEPVASMRLKRLRRSMQDAAYLTLLREHHLDHLADTIRDSLVAHAGTDAYLTSFADGKSIGWPDDPEVFESARRLMAEELSTSAYGEERGDREEFVRSSSWRRFLLATRRVETRLEGTRMHVRGGPAAKNADVVTSWTIANRTRLPVDAKLNLGPLPDSWSASEDALERYSIHLGTGESRRASFGYSLPLAAAASGKTALALTINAEQNVRSRADGNLALVIAGLQSGPLQIDGDLSDWPLGTTNVAGDFRLISGPGSSNDERSRLDVPRKRTVAFVVRDEESLYVAVNCELDQGSVRPVESKTGVTYDDLIPIGEELIELLIDPLNSGSRSPSDLLHIVVKRSGASMLERGVLTDPPCCKSSPWAAKIDIATRSDADRWTVEVRIPLAEIAPPPYTNAVLGFNVTRFDVAGEEFSTWSGAVGNAYDPLSLGNLVLP